MQKICSWFIPALLLITAPSVLQAQATARYNYSSQQKLIPAELGAIYLGMDLRAFSQKIKIAAAAVEDRFEELTLDIPFEKGNIKKLLVKFTGLTAEQKAALVKTEKIMEKTEYGDLEKEVKRMVMPAVRAAGKLYEISIFYKDSFDLAKYVVARYGKPGEVYKQGDQYHFFDMQWIKTSADKLSWLIRYYKETNALMLAGRIPGSEWSLE